jgi:AcrR family transcriptional regulator
VSISDASPNAVDRVVDAQTGTPGDHRGAPETPKRQRLIDACLEVVGNFGYHQARVTDICRAAGLTLRDFYAVFPGKEVCYVATLEAKAWELMERAGRAYEEADGPWEVRLRAGLEVAMAELAIDAGTARFLSVEVESAGPVGMESVNAIINDGQRMFLPAEMSQRVSAGVDGSVLVSVLSGAIIHTIATYVWEGKTEQLPELVPWFAHYLTLLVLGREPLPEVG